MMCTGTFLLATTMTTTIVLSSKDNENGKVSACSLLGHTGSDRSFAVEIDAVCHRSIGGCRASFWQGKDAWGDTKSIKSLKPYI